ncbi:MAG: hypothetical protein WBP94_14985 [Rhodomicrobiaceae bacterium]
MAGLTDIANREARALVNDVVVGGDNALATDEKGRTAFDRAVDINEQAVDFMGYGLHGLAGHQVGTNRWIDQRTDSGGILGSDCLLARRGYHRHGAQSGPKNEATHEGLEHWPSAKVFHNTHLVSRPGSPERARASLKRQPSRKAKYDAKIKALASANLQVTKIFSYSAKMNTVWRQQRAEKWKTAFEAT